MKATNKTWLVASVVAAILLAGTTLAHGGAQQRFATGWHTQMEEVMEGGTYKDLEILRETGDFRMMPWVDSREDFEAMQEHHETMEEFHEERGPFRGRLGYQGGFGCH